MLALQKNLEKILFNLLPRKVCVTWELFLEDLLKVTGPGSLGEGIGRDISLATLLVSLSYYNKIPRGWLKQQTFIPHSSLGFKVQHQDARMVECW